MVALGVFGTGIAYVWNVRIIAAWGAANASAVTYLTPVVGVLLGVLVLGEPVSWNQPAGAILLVVLGILAAHGRLKARRTEPSRTRSAARHADGAAAEAAAPSRTRNYRY